MRSLSIILAALASVPAIAQSTTAQTDTGPAPQLSLEQQTSLRCSAAFAIVASEQAAGKAEALSLPPLAERGREFFVRFSARLMDETGMTREQVAGLIAAQASTLRDDEAVAQVMPACLLLLDASGL